MGTTLRYTRSGVMVTPSTVSRFSTRRPKRASFSSSVGRINAQSALASLPSAAVVAVHVVHDRKPAAVQRVDGRRGPIFRSCFPFLSCLHNSPAGGRNQFWGLRPQVIHDKINCAFYV